MADSNIALTTFTTGAMTVAALNWLKSSPYFPWITKEKTTLLRFLSAAAAVASGAGIQHVWNPTDHSLVISGLTVTNVALFFWAIGKQFAMNETIFQVTKRTSDPAVVRAVAPAAARAEGLLPEKKP
jgi:predicted membrane protein